MNNNCYTIDFPTKENEDSTVEKKLGIAFPDKIKGNKCLKLNQNALFIGPSEPEINEENIVFTASYKSKDIDNINKLHWFEDPEPESQQVYIALSIETSLSSFNREDSWSRSWVNVINGEWNPLITSESLLPSDNKYLPRRSVAGIFQTTTDSIIEIKREKEDIILYFKWSLLHDVHVTRTLELLDKYEYLVEEGLKTLFISDQVDLLSED